MGGKQFDLRPEAADLRQALNLENYLYLAVLGFGVTQVVMVSGVFMVIAGIALGGTGTALWRLAKTKY